MLGIVPGWFLGKAFHGEAPRSTSMSCGSDSSSHGGSVSSSTTFPLQTFLRSQGYHLEDAKRIANDYFLCGLGAAINVVEDWDDDTHNYTGELCDVIHQWKFNYQKG
jgi:hypothetical protein